MLEPLSALRRFRVEDLAVWRHALPEPRTMLVPNHTHRTNPVLTGGLVVASIFDPPRILALDAGTGERRWERPLPYYGNSHVWPGEHGLLGGTSKELFSLDPDSGEVRWSFSPRLDFGELIYSSPVTAGDRMLIGDRSGTLHCLDERTGDLVWSARVPQGSWGQLNGTGVVVGHRFMVTTIAALALAFDLRDGTLLWRRRLARGSIFQHLLYRDRVLIQTVQSIYALDPDTGEIRERWTWREKEIKWMATAGDLLLVVLTNEYGLRDNPDNRAPAQPRTDLVAFQDRRVIWRLPYPRWSHPSCRFDAATGLLYEATRYGVGIVDVYQGVRFACIHGFGADEHGSPHDNVGMPACTGDRLYVIAEAGVVCALRHPQTYNPDEGTPAS